MSFKSFQETIEESTFLLEKQKEQVINISEDYSRIMEIAEYEKLIDEVFRKLLDISINDLSTTERTLLKHTLEDYNT